MKLTIDRKIQLVVGLIALTIIAIFGFNYRVQIAGAIGFKYQPVVPGTATSTVFMKGSAGAVATTTVPTDGGEQLTLLVMLGSSTTPPTLGWRVQYSNNGVDWYDEDVASTTAGVTDHVIAGASNRWIYSSTTANQTIVAGANNVKYVTKRIVIPALDTSYTRIVWLASSGGDALLSVIPQVKNEYVLPK